MNQSSNIIEKAKDNMKVGKALTTSIERGGGKVPRPLTERVETFINMLNQ